MTLLIHGDDNINSRNYYLSLKNEESILIDAESSNLVEISQVIKGSGLFQNPKKIFIDNLFTKKADKKFEQISNLISENENLEIILWAEKEVESKKIKAIKNLEIKVFKIPQNIWTFLDSIKPNNPNLSLSFQSTIAISEPEIVFAMIIRQFRLLIGISSNSDQNIDEIKRLAPWQKSKLVRQTSFFDQKSLKRIYKKLFDIEIYTKTGKTSLTLEQNIDFLLLEI